MFQILTACRHSRNRVSNLKQPGDNLFCRFQNWLGLTTIFFADLKSIGSRNTLFERFQNRFGFSTLILAIVKFAGTLCETFYPLSNSLSLISCSNVSGSAVGSSNILARRT